MPVCKKCQTYFPNTMIIDGVQKYLNGRRYCLECSPWGQHNTRQLHLPAKKRKKYNRDTKYQNNRRRLKKEKLIELIGGCIVCGYKNCLDAIDFHHVDKNEKSFNISNNLLNRKWQDILKEIVKTIPVCKNHHAEIHAGLWENKQAEWKKVVEKNKKEIYVKGINLISSTKQKQIGVCPVCGKEFEKERKNNKYCSRKCSQMSQRKVKRPAKEKLLKMLKNSSYLSVGKYFKVSDNTIRKWLK